MNAHDDTRPVGDGDRTPRAEAESDSSSAPDPDTECPYCGSTNTEPESRFGSEISKEQHYCWNCRTVFERIKYDGKQADTGRTE